MRQKQVALNLYKTLLLTNLVDCTRKNHFKKKKKINLLIACGIDATSATVSVYMYINSLLLLMTEKYADLVMNGQMMLMNYINFFLGYNSKRQFAPLIWFICNSFFFMVNRFDLVMILVSIFSCFYYIYIEHLFVSSFKLQYFFFFEFVCDSRSNDNLWQFNCQQKKTTI